MFRKNSAKDYHRKLIKDMQQVNLAVDSGVCFGYSVMALQAILLHDTVSFDRRMEVLFQLPADELASQMQAAFRPPLSSDSSAAQCKQKFYIDMQAFLGNVSMYQNLRSYGHLFNVGFLQLKQDISLAATIILPQKIMDQGGLAEAGRFYSTYHNDELQLLLLSLYETLLAGKIDEPVAFLVNSSNHALTFGFDPRYQCWMYMEVHDGVTQFLNHEQLAEKIHQAFSDNDYTTITTSAYAVGIHADRVAAVLNKWRSDDIYREAHNLSMRRIQAVDSLSTNLLYMIVNNNDVRRLATILKSSHVNVNQRTSSGLSALHLACMRGYTDCIKLLLNHPDIDVNQTTIIDKLTPLHIAFLQCQQEVAEALLRHKKIDIHARREDGLTVLDLAAYAGRIEYLDTFLNHGSDVNQANAQGMTALHYAVQENQIECVRRILKQPGVEIDKANNKGTTPLMMAAALNHLDVAKEILVVSPHSAGLDVNGMSAYDVAVYNKDKRMIDLLGWFVRSYSPAKLKP